MPVERRSRGPMQVIMLTLALGFVVGIAAQLTKRGLVSVLPGGEAAIDVVSSAVGTAIIIASIPAFIVLSDNTRMFEVPLLKKMRINAL